MQLRLTIVNRNVYFFFFFLANLQNVDGNYKLHTQSETCYLFYCRLLSLLFVFFRFFFAFFSYFYLYFFQSKSNGIFNKFYRFQSVYIDISDVLFFAFIESLSLSTSLLLKRKKASKTKQKHT